MLYGFSLDETTFHFSLMARVRRCQACEASGAHGRTVHRDSRQAERIEHEHEEVAMLCDPRSWLTLRRERWGGCWEPLGAHTRAQGAGWTTISILLSSCSTFLARRYGRV